jgi:metallo-beta-lactamase class B
MQRPGAAALALAVFSVSAVSAAAAEPPALWIQPQPAFKLFANTYYVGTRGLSAVLITSPQGHVLIDTGLPQSAATIAANIRALNFKVEDVKWILNSHAHSDHAGGIAALQAMSGAKVATSAYSAQTLQAGHATERDPQHALGDTVAKVATVEVLDDRQVIRIGDVALTMHHTPGHTPGSTSWTWRACEQDKCLDFAYADSLTAVSDSSFKYGGDARYPNALEDFRSTLARVASLNCDVLLTPHPEASDLWTRIDSSALIDTTACRRYANHATQKLEDRVRNEAAEGMGDRG